MDKKHNKGIFLIVFVSILLILGVFIRIIFLSSNNFFEYLLYKDPVHSEECIRGEILDRNGNILSLDTPLYGIEVRGDGNVVNTLSDILHVTKDEIREKLDKGVTFFPLSIVPSEDYIDYLKAYITTSGKNDILSFEIKSTRSYPKDGKNSYLGKVISKNKGEGGVEEEFNSYLSSIPENKEGIAYGGDITLTIDSEIQKIVEELYKGEGIILLFNSKDEIVSVMNENDEIIPSLAYSCTKDGEVTFFQNKVDEKYLSPRVELSSLYSLYMENVDEEFILKLKESLKKRGIIN